MDLLSTINGMMRDVPIEGIIDKIVYKNPLLARLRENVVKQGFQGQYMVLDVETSTPARAATVAENAAVPETGTHSYSQMKVQVRKIVSTVGATQEALIAATGSPASFAKFADRAIETARRNLEIELNRQLFGDSTARLAQVASASESPSGTYTITVDNTRADFGWDRGKHIRVGMLVDIYTGSTLRLAGGVVTSVSSSTYENDTIVVTGTAGATISDNDIIYVAGAKGIDINGLLVLVDDGLSANLGGSQAGSTFQGLDRTAAANSFLKSTIWRASDIESGGVDGTPVSWDLSVIDDAIDAIEYGNGKGEVTCILGNPRMIRAFERKVKVEMNPLTQVSDDGKIIGGIYVPYYYTHGRRIPLITIDTLSDNTLWLIDERDLLWLELKPISWWEEEGKSPWFSVATADRKTNFEAWMYTYMNIAAKRCDNFLRIEDLKDDE